MVKHVIALAISGAMSAPLAAQAAPQAAADAAQAQTQAQAQPAQPQMVKKCRRVPDYPGSGALGPSHKVCKLVAAKGNGSPTAQQAEETGNGGNK